MFLRTLCIAVISGTLALTVCAGVNEWTSSGPDGGSVTDLEIDPNNPSRLYALLFNHGLYLSEDAGSSWTDLSGAPGFPHAPSGLAIDPHAPDRLIMSSTFDGVFESLDGGRSWMAINEGLPEDARFFGIEIDPGSTTLYALSRSGLFRRQQQSDWQQVNGDFDFSSVESHPGVLKIDTRTSPSTLYFGGRFQESQERVFRSDDGGESWKVLDHNFGPFRIDDLELDPLSPSTLWLGTGRVGYKSEDRGETWTPFNISPGARDFEVGLVDQRTVLFGVGSGRRIYRSMDQGQSWTILNINIPGFSTIQIRFSQASSTLYAGSFGSGIGLSHDLGDTWDLSNAGLNASSVRVIALDPKETTTIYAATSGSGLQRSLDGGRSWLGLNSGLPSRSPSGLAIDPQNPERLYLGLPEGLFGSQDRAASWQPILLPSNISNRWALAVDPSQPATVFAASSLNGIFKSVDQGRNWDQVFDGTSGMVFNQIVFDPADPAVLYVPYSFGQRGGILRSLDGGSSWHLAQQGLPERWVMSVAVDPSNTSRLLAASWSDGFYLSEDQGDSWSLVRNIGFGLTFQLLFDAKQPSVVYAATRGDGVLRSNDGGLNWTGFSEEIPDVDFRSLAVDPTEPSTIYAGSEYWGVFERRQAAEQNVLWLHDGRFKVEVSWRDFQNRTGRGQIAWVDTETSENPNPELRSTDSAILQFFGPKNWEILVKVLDGRSINGNHWVFLAGTTNVGYHATVTDTVCGTVREIRNTLGSAAVPVADTESFPDCDSPEPPSCQSSLGETCLRDGRFRIEMTWTDFAGQSRSAQQASLDRGGLLKSEESGVFTFFGRENWELLVKVLDGCAVNDRFWVFSAATTNVGYQLEVTDTRTGERWSSNNALGQVAPAVTDTDAIQGCSSAD